MFDGARRRLTWPRYEIDDPRQGETADRTRAILYMYLVAPILGLLTLALPHPQAFRSLAILGVVASGFVVFAIVWFAFDHITHRAHHLLLAYASLAITAAQLYSGLPTGAYTPFYYWVLLYAARYYTVRSGAAHLALVVAGLGLCVHQTVDTSSALLVWTHGSAAMALTFLVVAGARSRVEDAIEALSVQALTDPLTGLRNRRCFQARLSDELARGRRNATSFALLLVDLDHFKHVNDSLGHDEGDLVLIGLAEILRREVRASDGVYRVGGEEFALVLPDATPAGALTVAEHLRQTVAYTTLGRARLTLSVGVAMALPGADGAALYHAADQAMYAAKTLGRNRVSLAPAGVGDAEPQGAAAPGGPRTA